VKSQETTGDVDSQETTTGDVDSQETTTGGLRKKHFKRKTYKHKNHKNKTHKKKYNNKYMSKKHLRRRHSRKRQRGGIFGAAQYNETLFGSNANEQNQHLLNGALYPSAQGIQIAQTYQGGSKRRRGGSLGFIGANVVPATLFASNMIYGNSINSKRYKRTNNKRTNKRKFRRHR
jgi:hypothetical protein